MQDPKISQYPIPLGVGFTYSAVCIPAILAAEDVIDYLVLSPEQLCRESRTGDTRKFDLVEAEFNQFLEVLGDRPAVVHGLELSIGSAKSMEQACVDLIDRVHARRPFPWFSEHLSFLQVEEDDGTTSYPGAPLPVPLTDEALDIVSPRAEALRTRYGVPFLLENVTHYLPELPADKGRDEIDFLNDLTERSGCGLLLDLYNLHCNALNHGFDAREALSRLRLDRVIEIHVAGGQTHDGFQMDVHADVVSEDVWDLLEWTIPQTPNLAGVTYELLAEAFDVLGAEGVRGQLERAKGIWTASGRPISRQGAAQ